MTQTFGPMRPDRRHEVTLGESGENQNAIFDTNLGLFLDRSKKNAPIQYDHATKLIDQGNTKAGECCTFFWVNSIKISRLGD